MRKRSERSTRTFVYHGKNFRVFECSLEDKSIRQRALYLIRRLSETFRINNIRGMSPRRLVLHAAPIVCNKDTFKTLSIAFLSGAAVSAVGFVHLFDVDSFSNKYISTASYKHTAEEQKLADLYFSPEKEILIEDSPHNVGHYDTDNTSFFASVEDMSAIRANINKEIGTGINKQIIKHVLIADSFVDLQNTMERLSFVDAGSPSSSSVMVADAVKDEDAGLNALMPSAGVEGVIPKAAILENPIVVDAISVPVSDDPAGLFVYTGDDSDASGLDMADSDNNKNKSDAAEVPVSVSIPAEGDSVNELTPQEISLNSGYDDGFGDAVVEDIQVASISSTSMFPKEDHVEAVADEPMTWEKFAVEVPPVVPQNKPRIAIIIDDLGLDRRRTANVMQLQSPLTMSFMSYAGALNMQTTRAKRAGHELMMHVPMEPVSSNVNAGPGALSSSMTDEELRWQVGETLSSFNGFVGINNHMGSKFTANSHCMDVVLDELKKKGLLFIDSRTSAKSVGYKLAAEKDMPYAVRHVFLDPMPGEAVLKRQLKKLEYVASQRGYAIGIGHPRDVTISALRKWLPQLKDKGYALVPVSEIIKYKYASGVMKSSKDIQSAAVH
ncbi:MAG: divergent polysaccharide deacetylase family protein [Alphaproteobacteria bacterium]|nr:divergent polysaccharide deacetylase family protein [Alphaproteobacteria bacterium]